MCCTNISTKKVKNACRLGFENHTKSYFYLGLNTKLLHRWESMQLSLDSLPPTNSRENFNTKKKNVLETFKWNHMEKVHSTFTTKLIQLLSTKKKSSLRLKNQFIEISYVMVLTSEMRQQPRPNG